MAKLGAWVLAVALALTAGPAAAMMGSGGMGGWDPHGDQGMGPSGGQGPGAGAGYGPGTHMGYGPGFHGGVGMGLYRDEAAEAHTHALEEADTDGDGVLTPEEFATYMEIVQQQRGMLIFERLDRNGDGMVGEDEFWRGSRRVRRRSPRW